MNVIIFFAFVIKEFCVLFFFFFEKHSYVLLITNEKPYRLVIKSETSIEQSYTCISVTIFTIENVLSSIWNFTISVTRVRTFICNFLFNWVYAFVTCNLSSAMAAWWVAGAKSCGDGLCWSCCGSSLDAVYFLFFCWTLKLLMEMKSWLLNWWSE